MSDNQKTPDEVLLPEGESLELLIAPDLPPELMPPAETALLDAPVDAIVQSEVVDAVSLGDAFPQESYLTEESTLEVQPLDEVSVAEITPLSEDDPALFDAVTPEAPVEITPSDEVVNFVEVTQEDTPAPIIVSEAVPITGEAIATPIVVSEPTSMPAHPAPTESSSREVADTTVLSPSPVVMNTPVAPPVMSVGDAPIILPTAVHHTSHIGLIIGGIALLGAAIVGAWFVFGSDDAPESKTEIEYTISAEQGPQQTYEETIATQVDTDEKNITFFNNALTEGDGSYCLNITDKEMQLECGEQLQSREFSLSGTLEDCQKLTLEDVRATCEATITQNVAFASMNKSTCSDLKDRDQVQYCRESIDEKILVNLVETKTATEAGCQQLEEKYQSTCVATIVRNDDNAILNNAVAKDDLDLCNTLSDEELKFVCFDTILLKRALVSKDKNLCDYVKDETKKATCISYASAQDDNTTFKNAIIEKNLNLCSAIGNTGLKDRCHDSVTLLMVRDTKNVALCDTLIATGGIDTCKKSAGVQ